MKIVKTDRSRIQTAQHCRRERWLQYHQNGLGVVSTKLPLPLAVGLSVHVGCESLLIQSMQAMSGMQLLAALKMFDAVHRTIEDAAVVAALGDFEKHAAALDLGTTELAEMKALDDGESVAVQMATSLGFDDADVEIKELTAQAVEDAERKRAGFDGFLAKEQAALVEGMVRAWSRRRLRPLLEQYEVLEVEREGEWLLSEWKDKHDLGCHSSNCQIDHCNELWFMSRPDALLLDRETNQLVLLSLKTTAKWDIRKERDAQHDMQGLSEGIEVEKRLAEWWQKVHEEHKTVAACKEAVGMTETMHTYLSWCDAPPRIFAVRYEFMLKGDRWKDKDLSSRFGMECRSQRSSLVRGYLDQGMASGDESWCHSWDYLKGDGSGEESKLYWKKWKSAPVWEHMPIAKWIDLLDDTAMAVSGDTGQELGYKSDAQAVGYTKTHPLDDVFIPPMTVYRNEDDLRDLVEQIEAQEVQVAESVAAVEAATDAGERRSLLNRHFPQSRNACFYPSTCAYVEICFGAEGVRHDPIGSGRYKVRELNHSQEAGRVEVGAGDS
jgi:hypothetical protein